MQASDIRIETDGTGIATLTLADEARRNALSPQMIAELTAFAARMTVEPFARAVILRGEGPVFCAGGDLAWMKTQFTADRATRMAEARKLAYMLKALNELPVPLIGEVHGGAFGGGVGLLCVCDSVVAAEGTNFGFTETRLGLIPATISPYVIARIGEGRARAVFMSGATFGTEEAVRLGIVRTVTAPQSLGEAARSDAEPYLAAAPEAVAAAKALARTLGPTIDAAVIEDTARRLADTWETPAARERVSAFLKEREKHKSS